MDMDMDKFKIPAYVDLPYVIKTAQKEACEGEKPPCDVEKYVLYILGNVDPSKSAKLDDDSLDRIKISEPFKNFKKYVNNLKKYIEGLDNERKEGFIKMVSDLIDTPESPVSGDKKLPESVINPGDPSPQTVKAGGLSHRSRKKVRKRSSNSKIRRKILQSRRVMQRGGMQMPDELYRRLGSQPDADLILARRRGRQLQDHQRRDSLSRSPGRQMWWAGLAASGTFSIFAVGLYSCTVALMNGTVDITTIVSTISMIMVSAAWAAEVERQNADAARRNRISHPHRHRSPSPAAARQDGGDLSSRNQINNLLSEYLSEDVRIYKETEKKLKPIIFEANNIINLLYNSRKEGGRSKRTKRRRIMNKKNRSKNNKKKIK